MWNYTVFNTVIQVYGLQLGNLSLLSHEKVKTYSSKKKKKKKKKKAANRGFTFILILLENVYIQIVNLARMNRK